MYACMHLFDGDGCEFGPLHPGQIEEVVHVHLAVGVGS